MAGMTAVVTAAVETQPTGVDTQMVTEGPAKEGVTDDVGSSSGLRGEVPDPDPLVLVEELEIGGRHVPGCEGECPHVGAADLHGGVGHSPQR